MPDRVMVRGPYRKGIKRRQEIIEAAARIFGERGYAAGSLRQIAADVGVTPAAITRHFLDKEELLMAVLELWDAESEALMPADMSGLDRFLCLPRLVVQHEKDRGLIELFLTIGAEATNPSHPASEFMSRRYERVVADGVADLRHARDRGETLPLSDAEIDAEVRGVFALMDGIQLQWLLDPSMDVVGAFRALLGPIIRRWTGTDPVWMD